MTRNFAALMALITDVKAPLPVERLHELSDLAAASATKFEQTWPTIVLHRRREIMRNLAEICRMNFEVDFTPIALLGIQDEDSQVRLASLDTLWDAESPELVKPLLEMMHSDVEVAVQASAAHTLGQFVLFGELGEIPHAIFEKLADELLTVFKDKKKALLVRGRALEAVAAADRDEITDHISNAYKSGKEILKISAVTAMGRSADHRWEPIVLAELENISPSMRYQAAQAAGNLELPAAVPYLIELLEDPDPEVMAAGIWALGSIGGDDARSALEPLLTDEEISDLVQDALDMIDLSDGIPTFSPFSREP